VKSPFKSLTIWGIGIAGAIRAMEMVGAVPPGTGQMLATAGELIGLAMVVVGRWRAKGPLKLLPSK
jgi:hypothetical protein